MFTVHRQNWKQKHYLEPSHATTMMHLKWLTKILKYKDVSLVVETTKCQHLQKIIHVHSTCQPKSIIIIQICCIFCTYHLCKTWTRTQAAKEPIENARDFKLKSEPEKFIQGISLCVNFQMTSLLRWKWKELDNCKTHDFTDNAAISNVSDTWNLLNFRRSNWRVRSVCSVWCQPVLQITLIGLIFLKF